MNNTLEQKYKEAQKHYEEAKQAYDKFRFQDAANELAKQLRQFASILETDPNIIFDRLPSYTDRIRLVLINIDNGFQTIYEFEQEVK